MALRISKSESSSLRIGVLSDIHLEHGDRRLIFSEDMDILVLAGDVHRRPNGARKFYEILRSHTSAPIIHVLGNHEYYKQFFPDVLDNYRNQAAKIDQVYVLEKDSQVIKGVRFLGTTLWADLSNPLDAMVVKHSISDFYQIKHIKTGNPILPDHMTQEHQKCKEWLTEQLQTPFNGPTIPVTHFVPSTQLIPDFYRGNNLNSYFYVRLDDLIREFTPEMWIYGHSHADVLKDIGATRMIANQAGHPYEGSATVRIKTWVLECPKTSEQKDPEDPSQLD